MLGLQFDNEIAAIQVFLVFLQMKYIKRQQVTWLFPVIMDVPHAAVPLCSHLRTYSKVEALSLLLIGTSLNNVCLAHVGVGGSRFDRLCGLAVLEGL